VHVLMVAERLAPAIGGVERHVAGLTMELVKRGHEVTLVAPAHARGLPEEEEVDGAHLLRLPRTGRRGPDYLQAWSWWLGHLGLLKEADVIHFHDVYALFHWFGPARLLCLDRPFYVTFHGYEMLHPVPLRAKLYRKLASLSVRGSICVGHYLIRWFRLHPEAVTYGAVTLPEEGPPAAERPAAVFLGRLARDMSPEIYLQGLGALKRDHHLVLPLKVCGDGPLRGEMEQMAKTEGIEAEFLGWVRDPVPHLRGATIAFASSYLAMLEAMARRIPVFAVSGNPVKSDYLRMVPGAEAMFKVASGPEELAEQLAGLLSGRDDPEARLERAYWFAAEHSWDRLAQTYIRLWGDR
jgi:glycosyltransferase involved in cell wall biosynthesis